MQEAPKNTDVAYGVNWYERLNQQEGLTDGGIGATFFFFKLISLSQVGLVDTTTTSYILSTQGERKTAEEFRSWK